MLQHITKEEGMLRVDDGRLYDTSSSAEFIHEWRREDPSDPYWYEEALFVTRRRACFIASCGGPMAYSSS